MTSQQLPPGADPCQIPAAVPPPGIVPNFSNHAALGPAIIAVSTVMLTLSTVFVVGRVWINMRRLRVADYFTVIGYVLHVAYVGLLLSTIKFAGHQWDIPACWFDATYMNILFAEGIIFSPATFFAKSAILLLYLQIFASHKGMRIAVYVGIIFAGLIYWPTIPLDVAFNASHPGESWADNLAKLLPWGVVQGSLAVVLDLYIFILPQPVLWRLNMSLRKRIAVMAVFFTALVGVVTSVVGLVYRAALLTTIDMVYTQYRCLICVVVENSIALIIGCVPAWRAIWKKHITTSNCYKTLSSRLHSNGSGHSDRQAANRNGSEKSLQRSVPRRENSAYEFGHYYPPPIVHIQGGIKDGHRNPDSADVRTGGIVRNFDITQEVHLAEQA